VDTATELLLSSASSADPPAALLMLLVGLLVWFLVARARGRVNADRCARYGHVPDPDTVGTWRERCRRCGTRL
jgi:hypothetical protein